MAVSTLAIGMIFVGGTFLTGIYLATVSTEQTIGTVVADEALAKIRLYGLEASIPRDECTLYTELVGIPTSELWYPSMDVNDVNAVRDYSWSALCRRLGGGNQLTQITVFVCRRAGTNARYWARDPNSSSDELEQVELPQPVRVNVVQESDDEEDELTIEDAVDSDDTDEYTFINDGATIVDAATGEIYRVLERYADPPERVKLDRPWAGASLEGSDGGWVWVVPRPVAGGRSPLVAVYQEVVRF